MSIKSALQALFGKKEPPPTKPAPLTTEQIREGLDNGVWFRHGIGSWSYYILRRYHDTIYFERVKNGTVYSISEFTSTDDITHIIEKYTWVVDFDSEGYYKKS